MFAFRFTAVLCDFLIYLISFIFHFLTVGRDGNFLQGNSQLSDHGRGKLLFDFGCVWFRQRRRKNVRNQRIGSSGEEQKDIKLKVVKSSSRFSIYFQLHFAFLLGVFRKCVSATLPADERRKWAKVEKPECKCGLLKRPMWKPNKIIYCFSICEILFDYNSHISIIFAFIQFSHLSTGE